MDALCAAADRAVDEGANILILSDRGVDREHAAIPALLALAGVHHHLIRQGSRTRVGLVVESGEPREIHHFALLIGYGAGAINPYLALETLADMTHQGLLTGVTAEEAQGQLHQGGGQGRGQGDGEDGHLHHGRLPRRADLRGVGAGTRAGRSLLHRHFVARERRRDRGDRRGNVATAPRGVRPARGKRGRAGAPAASTSGAPMASITTSTRSQFTSCKWPVARATTPPTRNTRR